MRCRGGKSEDQDDDDEDYDDDDDDIVTKDGYGMTNRVKIFITETIRSRFLASPGLVD